MEEFTPHASKNRFLPCKEFFFQIPGKKIFRWLYIWALGPFLDCWPVSVVLMECTAESGCKRIWAYQKKFMICDHCFCPYWKRTRNKTQTVQQDHLEHRQGNSSRILRTSFVHEHVKNFSDYALLSKIFHLLILGWQQVSFSLVNSVQLIRLPGSMCWKGSWGCIQV